MIRSVLSVALASAGLLFASGELSNRRAPGFALPDPEYKRYYDLQDYRGKIVLIDIMSTRCPHCQLVSTTLEQVKARYGDKVAILEVVLPPDNLATVSQYVAVNKVTVPVICDMGQMTASYFMATPATMQRIDVPHLFIIDAAGIIRNDFSYDEVFSRQVQSLVQPGDVVIGISTSGNSKSVIKGVEEAKKLKAWTAALTGMTGGKLKDVVDCCVTVPSPRTAHIQECHIALIHAICVAIDAAFITARA